MTLSIYSASAGSGKTHHLTFEYIKLALQHDDAFRHILAITFTNKATEEMKVRVLNELSLIASGVDTDIYNRLLTELSQFNEFQIRIKAHQVLRNILYAYHFFNISTIDSFFQQIMRIFTRELGVQLGYNLFLDGDMVMNEAITNMFDKLGGDNKLTRWLLMYLNEKMTEGKSWRIQKNISELAEEIIKESYAEYAEKLQYILSDHEQLKAYLSELNQIISEFELHQKQLAEKAILYYQSFGLTTDDFVYKNSGVAGWLEKLLTKPSEIPKARVIAAITDNSGWYSKSAHKNTILNIEKALETGLMQMTRDLYNFYHDKHPFYNTAKLIKNYFFILGITNEINNELAEIRSVQNILLIQDINHLLVRLTSLNNVPFIYERTGYWLKHLMIDEFQDTSVFQWRNLLPMLQNNIANADVNLVVGDVKQSIYRWRGGDWALMLKKVSDQIGENNIHRFTLNYNYRSCRQIVTFNNSIFTVLSESLKVLFLEKLKNDENTVLTDIDRSFANTISEAYKDVIQQLPENKVDNNGFVHADFIQEKDENGKGWKEFVLERLSNKISELINNGFLPGDITILVRKLKEARDISEYLLKNSTFQIISKESLLICSSESVKFLINSLCYMSNPSDKVNLAELIINELVLNKQTLNPELINQVLNNDYQTEWMIFLKHCKSSLNYYSLYSLLEELIACKKLNEIENEKAYLQAFLDVVIEYASNQMQDIQSFLDYWNNEGRNKSIKMPEMADGINVVTIHKSKGMQFKIVIIPFCDWDIDHNASLKNILWCKPQYEPFNKLPVVPVKYGIQMQNSIFRQNYFEEKLYAYMDNLNALYVAFTRAIDGLIFYCPINGNKEKLGNFLSNLFITGNISEDLLQFYDAGKSTFRMGEFPVIKKEKSEIGNSKQYSFISTPMIQKLRYSAFKANYEDIDFGLAVSYGSFMHKMISLIKTADDIQSVVELMERQGEVGAHEKSDLILKLNKIVNNEKISAWFTNDWKVLTEAGILVPGSTLRIPDRVLIRDHQAIVIDFKFSSPNPTYIRQLTDYMNLLKQMNYSPVNGYLIYISENEEIGVEQMQ